MIREALSFMAILFIFTLAWLIALPIVDSIIVAFEPLVAGDQARGFYSSLKAIALNALTWIGVLLAAALVAWLAIRAFRREPDTFQEAWGELP